MSAGKWNFRNYKIEIVVFVAVAIFVLAAAFLIKIPQNSPVAVNNLPIEGKAPEFAGIAGWINTGPLTMQSLRGKVVLVDFWTYSCINCIRTLPYLESWYAKYGGDNFTIVGVHSPEFDFEKSRANVQAAVAKYGITYSVALDSNHDTWNAYGNQYWPRDYIVDAQGNIRYDHIGEGDYNGTEAVIRALIQANGMTLNQNMTNISSGTNFGMIGTPEIYLGYSFGPGHGDSLGNPEGFSPDKVVGYANASVTQANTVYLSGEWNNTPDSMIAVNNSKLFLIYTAKDANIVAGGTSASTSTISIILDGKPLDASSSGSDVSIASGTPVASIGLYRLYNIVSTPDYGTHALEIDASPGFRIFTFTFG